MARVPVFALVALLAACRSPAPTSIWSAGFEPGEPFEFRMERTGNGALGHWSRMAEPGGPGGPGDPGKSVNHVLGVSDNDATSYRFPMYVRTGFEAVDGRLSVRFQTRAGEVDQAAGLVLRHRDAGNYYVLRANALEDNVRFYRLVAGQREQLAGVELLVLPAEWHELALEARGSTFTASLDGHVLFEVEDETFPGAGEVGLWTKADSVVWFDDLAWRP